MKVPLIFLLVAHLAQPSYAFEIVALGTSNTNCKGANQFFTKTLTELLKRDGIQASVINAGVNGDTPEGMRKRLESELSQHTKIVLFEPGANRVKTDEDKKVNLKNVSDVLEELQRRAIPVIFQSHYRMHTEEEARSLANTYGAYYYGHILRDIPVDQEHRQYDMPGGHTLDPKSAGHFTERGCAAWATNLYPLVKRVISEKVKR